MDTEILRREVLTLQPDASEDQVWDLWNAVECAHKAVSDLRKSLKEQIKTWMEENQVRETRNGDVRLYLGSEKKIKCRDIRAALIAAIEASGGEPDRFAGLLSSDAFKPGAMKSALGEARFAELFETLVAVDVKTDRPVREVKIADTRWIPAQASRESEAA